MLELIMMIAIETIIGIPIITYICIKFDVRSWAESSKNCKPSNSNQIQRQTNKRSCYIPDYIKKQNVDS